MRDELLTYFNRELTYLRQLGAEFAAKYPKVAGRLVLEPDRCEDPHVERLIEAVAFLTARTRLKIEDELPEITDSMLGILYPHYLAPVPSMAIVQFHLDPGQGQLTAGYEIPRHTELTSRPVRGVRCRFRTVYPVHLFPVALVDASLEHPLNTSALGGARDFRARCVLRLRLRAFPGTTLAAGCPPSLRLFLRGESALTAGLYEMLCGGPCQVEIHPAKKTDATRPLVLPRDVLRPVGFAREEMALAFPRRSHRAYALLTEYLTFPEKFLFVDLHGLDRMRDTGAVDEAEIRIFCGRAPGFDQPVQASTFRLGCTPVINLFERPAEPIWVDHTKDEYRVVADAHGPWAHEIYAVDSVLSVGPEPGQVRTFIPFYALRHGGEVTETYWHASRRQALDGASEVYLSLVDGRFAPSSPPVETLSLQVTCTNRDLPAQLPYSGSVGGDLDSEHVAPFVKVECLTKPSVPLRREAGRGAHWQLVSHLSLNYLSLVEQGTEALQAILELYDVASSAVTRRQVAGIRQVRTTRVVRIVGGAPCRGLRVTIEFDRDHFVGSGVYLFASILESFLGLYASINSFSQLEARIVGEEEPVRTWPPRAGEQVLL